MADHLEIEQKFDVDEDFERPDFGTLAGDVTAAEPMVLHLAATYYDTAGNRLAANKITLRRRTGGTDEGWHLKLPAGQDTRRELQAPLDEQRHHEVPERFAAQLAAVTGGLPLAPIAVLETERTVVTLSGQDGRVVAEIADDLVTARRLGHSAEAADGADGTDGTDGTGRSGRAGSGQTCAGSAGGTGGAVGLASPRGADGTGGSSTDGGSGAGRTGQAGCADCAG